MLNENLVYDEYFSFSTSSSSNQTLAISQSKNIWKVLTFCTNQRGDATTHSTWIVWKQITHIYWTDLLKLLLRLEQQHFFQIKGVIDYVRITAFRHTERSLGVSGVTDFDPLPVCWDAETRDIYQSVVVRLSYEQWRWQRSSQSLDLKALSQHKLSARCSFLFSVIQQYLLVMLMLTHLQWKYLV